MRNLLFILTILFFVSSCKLSNERAIDIGTSFDTLAMTLDSSAFYFYTKTSLKDSSQNALDSFHNKWYSKMLFGLKEPILINYQGDKEIYRFTWLRTFNHPITIRIENQSNIAKLFVKISNGAGGYKPGQIIFDTTFIISTRNYQTLMQKIDNAKFWSLPTEKGDETGKDGSEWIFEGLKKNQYHLVTRWTPSNKYDEPFKSIGDFLLELSEISKEEMKFYY